MMVYVNAFPQTIGQNYTELMTRARAADNQFFVATVSQARHSDHNTNDYQGGSGGNQGGNHYNNNYQYYGHSMFADPKGHVMNHADNREQYIFQTLCKFFIILRCRNRELGCKIFFPIRQI